MPHDLQDARRRGVPIVTFNSLRERGLERFTNPQAVGELLAGVETLISQQYHQVKAGGDLAAIMGLCKVLIERDALDHAFIDAHTHGFETFATAVRETGWDRIERLSGLTWNAITAAAMVYARANRTIGIYGMGLTQHRLGVQTVQMLVNLLLLLRGNIGKPGAGVCLVRGHSNVQGQRTVGITEKPELVPVDRLRDQYGFEPPTEKGLNTVEACEAILGGKVRAFTRLGGNFLRAVPERNAMEDAWRELRLTVQIATKPNHGQVVHGEVAYILPRLGRIEVDR